MRILLGTLALVTLAACGGASTPVTPPKPTPTVRQAAATAYLAAATKANDADVAAKLLCPGDSATAAQYQACYAAASKAEQTFVTSVFSITFPSDMKADVDALIKANSTLAAADNSIAQATDPTSDIPDGITENTASTEAGAAASVVRHDLELAPVPILNTPSPRPI